MNKPLTPIPKRDSLAFTTLNIPEETWQSKLQIIFGIIVKHAQFVWQSRTLQVAVLCLLFGVTSSVYGIYSLFSDSHLVCRDDHVLAKANHSQGENIDYFELEAAAGAQNVSEELTSDVSAQDDQNNTQQIETTITVDVSGAVKQPGVYSMPSTHRLGDAIGVAGGLTNQANAQEVAQVLNLASKLSDGQKVYIPFSGEQLQQVLQRQVMNDSPEIDKLEQGSASDSVPNTQSETNDEEDVTETSEAISINTATAKQLMELKGIGEKRAADIIASRPYDSVSDLLERGVLTTALFESVQDFLKL